MRKNPYPGKPSTRAKLGAGLVPHLLGKKKNQNQRKEWFASLVGKPILFRKKGAGFIVFEGLDGSGQTTQVKLLAEFLRKNNFKVLMTKEPTLDSPAGKLIKAVLDKKEEISPKKLQELFAQDRKAHLSGLIMPNLKKGKIVISDRYFFSSFAYGSLKNPLSFLLKINDRFLLPDLIFFINTKPKTCVLRIKKRGKNETLFEKKEKLEKVYQNYKKIFKKFKNVIIIDGEKSIKEVRRQIIKKIINYV